MKRDRRLLGTFRKESDNFKIELIDIGGQAEIGLELLLREVRKICIRCSLGGCWINLVLLVKWLGLTFNVVMCRETGSICSR